MVVPGDERLSPTEDARKWQQLKELFHACLEIPPTERAEFLNGRCPDSALRAEVESLLASHHQAGELLEISPLPLHSANDACIAEEVMSGKLIGPYRLIAKIGEGGMGSVYRAIRVDDHYLKQVAIKVLRPGLVSEHYLRRFKNERQIMASLDHPNIARLLDGGATQEGLPYFVLEYIEGYPIDQYCDSHKLGTVERLRLFMTVCSAVQYAHRHLVVHRDLKPANILITNEGIPKLLDFGIAKLLDPELFLQTADVTATAIKAMTPEYASPEQVRGDAITTASDIFSLGVLLYRLLTGHAPYRLRGHSLSEMARIICETEPVRPSMVISRIEQTGSHRDTVTVTPELVSELRDGRPEVLRKRLAGDLDNIVMKSMRKEPERRYSSVEKFTEDISRHLDGLPVCARPDTLLYRASKFIRRNKVAIAAAGIVFATLIGGIISTSHEANVARGERRRAEQRFEDVRKLANSMIFGFDDAIRDVPGSMPARKLLVDNATEYLDKLAREAKGDLSLQRELAASYERLGDVQGNPVRPNIGDTSGALHSYRQAIAIREALAGAYPQNDQEQYALAESHRSIGLILLTTGDLEGSLESARRAEAITEQLAKENPGNAEYSLELANVYKLVGDIEGGNGPSANLGDLGTALDSHEKALAIIEELRRNHQGDALLEAAWARLEIRIGDDLFKSGKRSEAVRRYETAIDRYQSLPANPGTLYSREIAVTQFRIADVHAAQGDWKGALTDYRRSMERVERAAAADPEDALARADVAESYGAVGRAMANSGDVRNGLELLRKGLGLAEQELARDPKRAELTRVLAFLRLWHAQILSKVANHSEALANYRQAYSLFRQLADSDPQDVDGKVCAASAQLDIARELLLGGEVKAAENELLQSLAVAEPIALFPSPNEQVFYTVADAYFWMGEIQSRGAQQQGSSFAKKTGHRTAEQSWFQKSVSAWRRIQTPGQLGPSGFYAGSAKQVLQKLRATPHTNEMLLAGSGNPK